MNGFSTDDAKPLRRVVICADDYAISPAVSQGIRELAEAGRLSATGAMTCMPAWPAEAPRLKALPARVAVGLHMTLTDQHPLGPMPVLAPGGCLPSLGVLIAACTSGRLPIAEVAAEVDRQLNAFEEHYGRPPDFIDGHQHVHLFPGIRRVVLDLFGRRLDPKTCWLRDCTDHPIALLRRGSFLKAGGIALLGRGLASAARVKGIRTNRGFSGFYRTDQADFAKALGRMLDPVQDGHLTMVHPGHVDRALEDCDSLTTPREAEWRFLISDAFPRLLADRGLAIADRGVPA